MHPAGDGLTLLQRVAMRRIGRVDQRVVDDRRAAHMGDAVLGDQLDLDAAAFDGFDPALDAVWMAEVAGEATHVWSHRARIALFLAAMRHFRDALHELLKDGTIRIDTSGKIAGQVNAISVLKRPKGL